MGQEGQNYGKRKNLSSNSSDGDAFKDWAKDVQECEDFYKVKVKAGLSSNEVENRCRIHGSNELEKHEGQSIWSLILEQFNYTLVQILLAAAIISFVLAWIDGEEGREKEITLFVEPLVVFLILIVNAIMGVWQESNAEKVLEVLPCLALGTRKMSQKNGLVQNLPSGETLGCTTVICSDKAGTLATNQMAAAKLVAMGPNLGMLRAFKVEGTSYNPSDGRIEDWPTGRMDANLGMMAKVAAVCNDAEVTQSEDKFVAHGIPTEAALKVLVEKMGLPEESRDVRAASASTILRCCGWWIKYDQRIATLEFDRDRKSMGVIVNSAQGKKSLLVKGAVENLLARSSKVQLRDGSVVKLDDNAKNLILQALHEMSTSALRCLGFAYKDDLPMFENYSGNDDHPAHQLLLDPSNYPSIESELIFAGLVGLRDPPREEVYQAIEDCRVAGSRIMVITGDNKNTAEAICHEIGVFGPNEDISLKSITGKDFVELRDKRSHLRQSGWLLFSRAEPGHKQEIVKLLKEEGEVVAMIGDGVNEATALKLEDIGIAGTEVAKEASDMVLADDNFGTVVTAAVEDRSIYNNMKAFIRKINLHFHSQVSGFSSTGKVAKTPYYLLILLLFSILSPSTAEIKSLTINSDTRPMILFEKFGFTHTGHVSIAVSSVSVTTLSSTALPEPSHLGFFLLNEESLVQVLIEIQQNPSFCVLDSHYISRLFTFSDLSPPPLASFNRSYPVTTPNEYSLFFANCVPETAVSMVVRTEVYNLDSDGSRDYLSAGQTQLPTLYFLFSFTYFAFLGFWAYICYTNKRSVHRIHLLMSGLLLVKALNLIFATEDKHFVKVTGTPHGWDVLFYIFQFVRVVLLFTVIILIGTGWSFLKPFLQEREKKVLMIVIPLQVLANVASVVIGETGPFIKDWVTWNQVFLLVDIICCCAIIFPIVWSIRSLRETSKTDGKAARNLAKLSLFRQFYIVVIGYLYFTRIVVFALRTIAAYKYQWVSQAAEEIASLAFYIVMFYMFRPVEKNEYFVLDEEEEEAAEMALRDEEFEL